LKVCISLPKMAAETQKKGGSSSPFSCRNLLKR
jgi:hypothetical protein